MTSKHSVVLKPATKAAVEEPEHRVPYQPREWTCVGNMKGNPDAQLIAADHRRKTVTKNG